MKNILNKRKYCTGLDNKHNTAGELIFKKRTLLNLSRQSLSNQLMLLGIDISAQAIYDIELGKRTIVDYELCAFSKILDISSDELLQNFRHYLNSI